MVFTYLCNDFRFNSQVLVCLKVQYFVSFVNIYVICNTCSKFHTFKRRCETILTTHLVRVHIPENYK